MEKGQNSKWATVRLPVWLLTAIREEAISLEKVRGRITDKQHLWLPEGFEDEVKPWHVLARWLKASLEKKQRAKRYRLRVRRAFVKARKEKLDLESQHDQSCRDEKAM